MEGASVPELDRAVDRTPGELLANGRECQCHRTGVASPRGPQPTPRRGVPECDARLRARRREKSPVGRVGQHQRTDRKFERQIVSSDRTFSPDPTSHNLVVPSVLAEARVRPSGENARQFTLPADIRSNTARGRRAATSQSAML